MTYKIILKIERLLGKTTIYYKGVSLITFWFTGGTLNGNLLDIKVLNILFNLNTKKEVVEYFLLEKTSKAKYEININATPAFIKQLEKLIKVKKTGL